MTAADDEKHSQDETLRLLIERVEEYAIFILDAEGYVRSWNAGAQRMKGYSADEVIGKHFSVFYMPADVEAGRPARILQSATENGKYQEEGWRVRKDGTPFWANVLITALVEADGTLRGFSKVTRDMTERRESEKQLARALELAEAANHAKDEFLTTISHELRTPLTSILGWASLLRLGGDATEVERGLVSIEESARAQARLVDDLIDFSRIASGTARLQFDAVDIDVLLTRALEGIRPTAIAKNITVTHDLPADRVEVLGDGGRLQQVLWNLLSNAVKFTPEGGRVTVRAEASERLTIDVTDSGRGLSPAIVARVFDRFWQADASSTRAEGGLGLGLSIARQLTELHGGTIEAESPGLGAGATFRVCLPILTRTARAGTAIAEPVRLTSLRGLHVLIVEDDLHARRFLTALVEQCGAHVTPASSVAEALDTLAASRPDVIVTDIAMPGEDGLAFIRRLRLTQPSLPAIAVTAIYVAPEDRARLLSAGFSEYMRKPIVPAELAQAIDFVVKKSDPT